MSLKGCRIYDFLIINVTPFFVFGQCPGYQLLVFLSVNNMGNYIDNLDRSGIMKLYLFIQITQGWGYEV